MNHTRQTSTWTAKQRDGYPALADFIAQDPDHETFVFRRFKGLSARNILNLQGELIALEDNIAAWEREAADSVDPELHLSMRSWAVSDENYRKNGRNLEQKQKALASALEVKLKKYYEALMLQRDIARLESPSPRVLAALRVWSHGTTGLPNDDFSKFDDSDREMFTIAADLVALRPPPDQDLLSRLLRDHWPFPVERLSTHDADRFRHFKDQRLSWVVTSLSVTIAAFLLACPIVVLYFVTNPNARLALVITFIVFFALGLSVTTSANRDAIFAATAAYAAVLVVFVSGDLANAK